MPEMKTRKLQNVRVRRPNAESAIEAKASVQISQTVSFAAIRGQQAVPVYNATWEFDAKNSEQCPGKGGMIIDANNTEWQVQKVVGITHRQVRQCQAYTEVNDFLPFDFVNIVRARALVSQNGARTTVVWRQIKSNMSTKIAREDLVTHRKSKAKTPENKMRAYTREFVTVQKNDLIELPDGRQYKIVRVRNSRQMLGWSEFFLTANERPVTIEETVVTQ